MAQMTTTLTPADIYVDSVGNIYLQGQNELSIYDSNKKLVSKLKVNISNFRRFTLDKSNNIFLQSGSDNNVIEKYNNSGELIASFGGFGDADGKFNNSGWTADIVTDSTGNVYMQDVGSGKVQKFDNNGVFLKKWDVNISAYSYMAIDELDNIYVVERGYSEINKYNTDGNLIKKYYLPKSVVMGGGSYIFVKKNQLFISHRSDHNIKILSLSE
jgi:sugar lactone lactonase YvrE